jgi:hypothetical protein
MRESAACQYEIAPGDLPDGLFFNTRVKPLSKKYFCFTEYKSSL